MSRSDSSKPVIIREKPTEPSHGTLSAEQILDAVLMHHPNYGDRYILNAGVERKKKQGFTVVGGEKPAEPSAPPLAGKKVTKK